MEIKRSSANKAARKAAKRSRKGLERKRSVEYMEEIEREEKGEELMDSMSEEDEEYVEKCARVRYTDARCCEMSPRSRSRSRSI